MQCFTSKLLNHRIHAYLYRATSQHVFHSKANDQTRWTGWSARTVLLVHVSDRHSNPDSKEKTETEALFWYILPDFILSKPLSVTSKPCFCFYLESGSERFWARTSAAEGTALVTCMQEMSHVFGRVWWPAARHVLCFHPFSTSHPVQCRTAIHMSFILHPLVLP